MENSFSRTSSHVLSKSIFDIKNYKKNPKNLSTLSVDKVMDKSSYYHFKRYCSNIYKN